MIKIIIPGNPIPWRAPFVGKKGCFSPRSEDLKRFKSIVDCQYFGSIIEGAVICDVICYMPIPKGTSKIKRGFMLSGGIRPTKRPDRTNIAKLMEDALNGTVIYDDSQIVGGRVEKWYCENPRVEMLIFKIAEVE